MSYLKVILLSVTLCGTYFLQADKRLDDDLMEAVGWGAGFGNDDEIDRLVERGADVNTKDRWGQTPLHKAANSNHGYDAGIVSTLLKAGANVNAVNNFGRTPLHIAAKRGNPEIINTILRYKPKVNIKDNEGKTALDYAKAYEIETYMGGGVLHGDGRITRPIYLLQPERKEEMISLLEKAGALSGKAVSSKEEL
jgi:hypothetical protein